MNNKKITKVLTIGLSAVMLFPSAIVSAKEFKDVKKNEGYGWAYEYIDEMSNKGVIEGYPDDTFKPDKAVNFEETLQLLKGIINPSSSEIAKAVEKYGAACDKYGVSSWAKDATSIAIDKNIITEDTLKEAKSKGFIDSTNLVYPNRNTIAVYFGRGLNLSSTGSTSVLKHKDISKIPESTKGYLASLVEAGIFSATGSEGNFDGDRYIRRSEMAKITKLSYDYKTKTGALSSETKDATGTVVLSTSLNNLDTIIIEKDSKRSQFRVNSSTTYKMNDKSASFNDIKSGQEVKITYNESNDTTVTGVAKTVEVTNSAKDLIGYITATNSSGITVKYAVNKDNIDMKSDDIKTTDNGSFDLANDAKIYELGKEIKAADLKTDSLVEFKTDSSGKVTELMAYPKNGTVTGEITSISSVSSGSDKRETIKLKLDNNKTYTFYGNYINNNNTELFRDLRSGNKVTLTTNYKIATRVGDNKNGSNIGEIVGVYRSDREISFKPENGERVTYYLTNDTAVYSEDGIKKIQVDPNELEGRYVELELDGNRVTKITYINKDSVFRAVAQVIEIKVDGTFGSTTKTYKIKVLDRESGSIEKGAIYYFDAKENYDLYEILEISGYKSGNSLGSVSIKNLEKQSKEIDSYDYRSKGGSINW